MSKGNHEKQYPNRAEQSSAADHDSGDGAILDEPAGYAVRWPNAQSIAIGTHRHGVA
jgi:hypothetical protein